MRQRRRAERGHYRPAVSANRGSARDTERLKQRLVLWGGIGVATALVAVLLGGFYWTSYLPPRRVVAQVADREISLRDVLPTMRVLNSTAAAGGGGAVAQPNDAFGVAVGTEVLRRMAPIIGIAPISDAELDQEIAQRFDPAALDGSAQVVALGSLGQRIYDDFLAGVGVSDAEYRAFVEGQVLRDRITARFHEIVPAQDEAVLLSWIVAPTSVDAQDARDRIDAGEGFAAIAAEISVDTAVSDENGLVGWVPRQAFPEFDEQMFAAAAGDVIGPVNSSLDFVILRVEEGPSEQTIAEPILDLVVRQEADAWFGQQWSAIVTNLDFDVSAGQWLVDNLR